MVGYSLTFRYVESNTMLKEISSIQMSNAFYDVLLTGLFIDCAR